MGEKRNTLFDEKPFTSKLLKDRKAQISYKGEPVAVLEGKDYNRLLRVIALDNVFELQLFLAKATGYVDGPRPGDGAGR